VELAPLLVVLGLAVVVLAFIARPLVEGRAHEPDARERRLSTLRADQDQTLALIHELDMDFAMGKIEPADYQVQRASRLSHGATLMREIEELEESAQQAPSVAQPPAKADLEEHVARLRTEAGGFCSRCGRPLVVQDRFCSRCGHPVAGAGA
jgi:hypothetical protein